MILNELYNKQPGYQDADEDQSKARIGDLRKTKLTLKQLNKLRVMNDVRTYERAMKAQRIQLQYGTQENDVQL